MKKPYAILGALILSTPVLALAQRERPRTIQVEVDRPTPSRARRPTPEPAVTELLLLAGIEFLVGV